MPETKELILRRLAQDTFGSLHVHRKASLIDKERKGFREGTRGLAGARMIEISRLRPDPDQPRKRYHPKSLKSLVASISKYGLLQPVTVEYEEDRDSFKIITGHRRFEAARQAQLSEIPCIVKDTDSHIRLIHQLTENIQRRDLGALEEAEAIHTLIRNRRIHQPRYSQREAARELGLPKTYVNELLSLLKLPDDLKKTVRVSDAVPKSLLLLLARQGDGDKIRSLYDQMREGGATVRDLKARIRRSNPGKGRPPHYRYTFSPPDGSFVLTVKFKRTRVATSEVRVALSRVLEALDRGRNRLP